MTVTVAEKHAADPASTRTAPRVSAVLDEGNALITAAGASWRADLPPVLGGTGTAPSPTVYLLGALAGCAVAFTVDTLAPEFGVRIEAVEATAACRADIAGLAGVAGVAPDLTDLTLDIAITSSSDPAAVSALRDAWLDRCPILLALTRPLEVSVSFT